MTTRTVNPWAAMTALLLGFFMLLLDSTAVSLAVPSMLRDLNTGLNSVVWVISVYLLAYAVPMLFTSRLGDRFGPKRVFLAGLVVFTGASLWCGLSDTAGALILARGVQGLGAALMTPQTLAFVGHLFPPARRGTAMGLWAGVAGLATVTGPLIGGVLVDYLGWEWIFFINVPVGVLTLVLTLVLVPDWQPGHAHSFDLPGIALSAVGLFCVVFGVQNGQHYDWGTAFAGITVFEIIAFGVLLLVAFALWQRFNRREPLVPLAVFANRNFSTGTLTAVAVGFAITGMFLPLVIYVQAVRGMSPSMAGLLTAPMSLVSGLVGPFVGRASDRVNPRNLVMFGLTALAAGLGIVVLMAAPDTNPWSLVPALLVCGLGIGCIFAPMSTVTMGSVQPHLAGTASGIYNTSRQVGGVLGTAAIGVLLQARISASVTDEARDAAQALPEQYRAPFVQAIADGARSAGEFGGGTPAPVPGLPADIAAQVGRLATEAVHAGMTDAARVTLLLPMGVLLLGVVTAAFMRWVPKAADVPEPTGTDRA